MNILGISGTPRENGNSDILLEYSLKSFIEHKCNVKHIRMSENTVHSCTACDSCQITGECAIEDDMQQIYEYFDWCHAIIISTPVYYRNVSAKLLAVLERYYAVKNKSYLKNKIGGVIAVGRGTTGGQSIAINIIYNWMRSCGMICVPGELNGVTAVADKPGDILKQKKKLQQAATLGLNVFNIASKLNENELDK